MRGILTYGLMALWGVATAQPVAELPLTSATLTRMGESAVTAPVAGRFGPGNDSVDLPGGQRLYSQLQWTCEGVPEGEYTFGLPMLTPQYFTVGEYLASRVHLYLNDERVVWTAYTEPRKPEDAGEKTAYQTELRADAPVRVRPGDLLRVMYAHPQGAVTVGALRMYADAPGGPAVKLSTPDWGRPQTVWLHAWLEEPERDGDTVRQPLALVNPGSLPRALTIYAEAKDYLQNVLLDSTQDIALSPGQRLALTFDLKPGDSGRARLALTATADGVWPDVRLSKFYVDDRTTGPRPSTCLHGEWEMCYVASAEPGDAPPADAQWEKINVPSMQSNQEGHCAWYRRTVSAPAHIRGERIVLRFGQVLTEAWFYLNGQPVGHELHGSQPFEVDVTRAFRPGEANELLIAVRDWLSYSPKNLERVARGEEPIYKDSMTDVAGYTGASNVGMSGSVWLEARPAVSVDDVFIVTSVREKKLSLHYRLINKGNEDQATTLAATVMDAGQVAKTLPEASVTVPAGKTAEVDVELPWSDPKLWWNDDPHLYVLQTDLKPQTGAADRHVERFGFREMWIDGTSLYLNGTRVKIRSAWASGASGLGRASGQSQPEKRLEALWDWQTECVHHRDHQLTRTHNMAGVEEACDIADETGLMIKLEVEVSQVSFTFDQAFWNAALAAELRAIDKYKNHAAVVMWSAGNENMWGWIYQGEAAKTLGNRWQIKIAKAMRAADEMARPIEWEADGDLMGGWEHHALHYPRELNQFPDLPNGAWWGTLDGKTVVPYSMGPITLGEKPLTVGECFWPATLRHPFGETILIGDDAYLGGNFMWDAWIEQAQYFLNGFRDVEFALIDTYVPLSMLPPQTVVLKQEDRAFVGGRKLHRDLNVHNDLRRAAGLTVRWTFTMPGISVSDRVALRCEPAEMKRVPLAVPLPKPTEPTPARWRVELLEGDETVHAETREWTIYPPAAIRVPAGLKAALYDPRNETAETLDRLGVPFERLRHLKAPDTGALIIGKDALKLTPQGPWRESLEAFVKGGGKVVVLEQSEAPDFLPVPLTISKERRMTMAYVRASDHPLVAGLTDNDLRWWTPDQYVSESNYRKPVRGSFVPLVDAGTMDGLLETPLIEEYDGRGSYLLCQVQLTEKAGVAPAATRMLQNLLDYLAAEGAYRKPGRTAVLAAADSGLKRALDEARLEYEVVDAAADVTTDRYEAAVVDAQSLTAPTASSLRAFGEAGGHVFVHRGTPEQQAALGRLTGLRLRFFPVADEPPDVGNRVCRRAGDGLLAGISNHEFFWASNAYLAAIRHEGVWWSYYPGGRPEAERIADFFCAPGDDQQNRSVELTRPGTLVQVPIGEGYVVLSQLRIDEPVADTQVTVDRLTSLLLTNLGCTLRGEGGAALARTRRLKQYQYATVDLSAYANRGLRDDPEAGLIGWTNQGENDMRALLAGRQTFGGVPFLIATPKAAVVLYSVSANNKELPREVAGIQVGQRADAVFFLHSMAWGAEKPFAYRVNYDDGTSEPVEIINGRQVIDWWDDPIRYADAMSDAGAFVAWTGDNPMRKGVVLIAYEWVNPHPERPIRDVDFLTVEANGYATVPVLAGLTAAVMQTNEGLVTDVIGTQGIRVKVGTEELQVYYIGTVGIKADHPYHEQAVAAHRALVVGQKVTLRDDVVTQNTAGQRIAYVYLGEDIYNVNNLVNAKIIGDGLGELGNFEGNTRERMYLENLGFIAKQRRAGMWVE